MKKCKKESNIRKEKKSVVQHFGQIFGVSSTLSNWLQAQNKNPLKSAQNPLSKPKNSKEQERF